MTAMPQRVALGTGVGGGQVASSTWVQFRNTVGFSSEPLYVAVASLFGAIIGSISFWGSNIAFGKLQELIPGRPITLGRAQQFVNLALAVLPIGLALGIRAGSTDRILIIRGLLAVG